MPALVHSFLALAIVLFFKFLRPEKITWPHIIVFSAASYIGPDIGSTFWFMVTSLGGDWGWIFLLIFHNPFSFTIISFLLAFPVSYLTRIALINEKKLSIEFLENSHLDYSQCVLLLAGGGFIHFLLDYNFHEAGHTKWYWWIIETGYWENPYLDWWVVIPLTCFILLFGVMYYVIKEQKMNPMQEIRLVVKIFIICSTIYTIYLTIRHLMGLAPIGEEPDLGIMIFMTLFLIWPLVLFLWSCFTNNEKIKLLIEELIRRVQHQLKINSIQKSILRFQLAAKLQIENYLATVTDNAVIQILTFTKSKI